MSATTDQARHVAEFYSSALFLFKIEYECTWGRADSMGIMGPVCSGSDARLGYPPGPREKRMLIFVENGVSQVAGQNELNAYTSLP